MAPTIQNGVEQSAITDSQDSDTQRFADLLQTYESQPKPRRRQLNQAETVPVPPNPESSSLHAKIIPSSNMNTMTTSQSSTSRFGHLSIMELILISFAALIVVIAGVTALVMMRSIIIKKVRRLLCGYGRRQAKKSKPTAEDKGALVNEDELNDPAWGTPPRLVYVEGLDDRLEERQSTGPFPSPDSPPSSPSAVKLPVSSAPITPRLSAACEDDSFQGRLEYEEHDITLALTRALRDITDESDFDAVSVCSRASGDSERYSSLRHLKNSSILDSLQASIDDLANGIASSSNRPRQCSDASTSSQATTAARSDSSDFFFTPSSDIHHDLFESRDSSMTSLESVNSSLEGGPEEMEVVYEVRRAHAQSLELKKGVLVTCKRTSSIDDITTPGMLPTFLISEAPPSLMPLDDLNFAPLFSLSNSMPSKASLSGCTATPSWSSIIRENSRGTMASLSSSSSTTMDEWTRDDERHLQPPIPFLMLTRPSDSSIYTAESFMSSVSVDLCDFPLPPISTKPSYYSKLVDQVQRVPKRIWDNHSSESSVAQKRSTVERFIMMYSSA